MTLILSQSLAYALQRKPEEAGAFIIDMKRFGRVIRGETEYPPKSINIAPTVRDLETLTKGRTWIAYDIETAPENSDEPWTGKDPTRAKLKSIAFGTETDALAIWWADIEEGHPLKEAVRRLLVDESITKVGHNQTWFDSRVLERAEVDCPVRGWEDTRDFRRALSSTSRLSLRYLASLYTDFEPWKENEGEDDKVVFTKDRDTLLRYNALDTIVTARVYARMKEEVAAEPSFEQERLAKLYERNKWKSIKAAEMHTFGFKVDTRQREFMDWALGQQYTEQAAEVQRLVNMDGFRCTPNDLRKLIFKRHETTSIKRFSLLDPSHPKMWTATGQCAVNNDALTLLLMDPLVPEELKRIIKAFWHAESTRKARSTFVSSELVTQAIGLDGRLRPGWNSLGANTGRWTCSQPNIMNLEQQFRAMYGVEPHRVLVHADFAQLEIKVRYAVTGDEDLGTALKTGDLYTEDAKAFFGLPAHWTKKDLKKAARDLCKMLHLATQYSAGISTIYQQVLGHGFLDVKYEQVAKYHEFFRRKYAGTVRYWQEEHNKVLGCGYSETRIYRQRRLYAREPPPTETVNFPIQGTAAEVADDAMKRVDERLKREVPSSALVVQLHDAFDVDCPVEQRDQVARILQEEMGEHPVVIGGKTHYFPVEIKSHTHWHEL